MESNGVAEQLQRLEYRLAAVQSVAAIASQDANTTTAQDQLDNQTSDAAMESIGTARPSTHSCLILVPGCEI
jgi:hypothetical protein